MSNQKGKVFSDEWGHVLRYKWRVQARVNPASLAVGVVASGTILRGRLDIMVMPFPCITIMFSRVVDVPDFIGEGR